MPTFALGILCENVQNSVNKCSILNIKAMKKLLLLAVALVGSVVAKADSYSVSDVTMITGSTGVMTVSLTNAAAVRDFQVSVAIPSGFTFVSASTPLSYYTVDTDAVANTTTNATATFIGYSTGNAGNACTIAAGTTEVLQITVSATGFQKTEDVATSAGKATNDAAAAADVTAATFDMVASYLGDANVDGTVDTNDATKLYNFISGTTTISYMLFANAASGDSVIDTNDAAKVYNIIGGNSAVKGEIFVEEAAKADANIVWGD